MHILASARKSIEMRIMRGTECRQQNCICCVLNRTMCFYLKGSSRGRLSKMQKRKFFTSVVMFRIEMWILQIC